MATKRLFRSRRRVRRSSPADTRHGQRFEASPAELLDPERHRLIGPSAQAPVFHLLEDVELEPGDPILEGSWLRGVEILELLESQHSLGIAVESFDDRPAAWVPPGEPGFESIHQPVQLWQRVMILEEAVSDRRGDDPDSPTSSRRPSARPPAPVPRLPRAAV